VIGVVVQQQNIRDHKVEGPELAGIARLEAEEGQRLVRNRVNDRLSIKSGDRHIIRFLDGGVFDAD
jgi:hypothetical protein